MPHLTVRALDDDLKGNESDLIAALTDAVTSVYGEWVRDSVMVILDGIPAGRWGVGGRVAEELAPIVEFGIREEVFARPDAPDLVPRLLAVVTDAVTSVLGERVRADLLVELIGTPAARTGIGGAQAPRAA
jgi:phenylpyruvate tautomerase PptA (4-oxalocrotonate tautomerase family)